MSPSGGEGISVVNSANDVGVRMSIAGGDWGFIELYDPDPNSYTPSIDVSNMARVPSSSMLCALQG